MLIVTRAHNRTPGAGWLAQQNGVPSLSGVGGQQVWLLPGPLSWAGRAASQCLFPS